MRVAVLSVAIAALCLASAVVAQPPPPANLAWFSACASGSRVSSVSDAPGAFRLPGQSATAPHLQVAYTVVAGYNPSCTAQGYSSDDIATTGWNYVHIESSPTADSFDQAYAAGYLEGYLTPTRNWQSYVNGMSTTFGNMTAPQRTYDWNAKQNDWINVQAKQNPGVYWNQVLYVYTQLQGITDGYAAVAQPGQPISAQEMQMVNTLQEADDIALATDYELRAQRDPLTKSSIEDVHSAWKNSHCSALIRLSPDGQDLFAAHTTWSGYATMLRQYKTYKLALAGSAAVAIQFSGYPATLSSVDDYYQSDAKMIIIETTNNVANMSLYEYVAFTSVPTWVRTVVANRVSSSGEQWASIYEINNSGTYNNQWMILDLKQFTPGGGCKPNTLWIASQIPGQVESADVTDILVQKGYWSSYNIPYFPDLWATLGYASLEAQYPGPAGVYYWSYANSFRAELFDRDAPKVATIADMQRIMQENNWQTDPLSQNSAQLAICARNDLSNQPMGNFDASGSIDAKVSSWQMMTNVATDYYSMPVLAISGPTHQTQAPFVWSTSIFEALPHLGQPDSFDFDWQLFQVAAPPAVVAPTVALM